MLASNDACDCELQYHAEPESGAGSSRQLLTVLFGLVLAGYLIYIERSVM